MEKILISACFLGEKVRYDGGHQRLTHSLIAKWQQQKRLISVCPEVSGGLSIPRKPAEINRLTGTVINCDGIDVTDAFEKGANHTLKLCQKYNIRYALMKESSPSCGSELTYDGSFSNTKIMGQGVTAALLTKHGIKVFSEDSIEQLAQLIAHS